MLLRACSSQFNTLLTFKLRLQQGELEHRNIKRRYVHTNKHNYIDQMVNIEVLERVHERMNEELVATAALPAVEANPRTGSTDSEDLPDNWCHISQDQSQKIYLPQFLNESQNATDPAFKVSTGSMQMYLEFRTLTNPRIRTSIANS